MTYNWVYNNSNTTGSTCGAGTTYPSGAPGFITIVTRRVPHVEQELITLPEHLGL